MKKLFTFVIISLIGSQLFSQSQHELGLRMASLRDFSAMYKKELDSGKWLRTSLGGINFSLGENFANIGFNANLGLETRKSTFTNLILQTGPNFGISTNYFNPEVGFDRLTLGLGFGYVIGLAKEFKQLIVSLEVIPNISASFSSDFVQIDGNISVFPVYLNVLYRLESEKSMK